MWFPGGGGHWISILLGGGGVVIQNSDLMFFQALVRNNLSFSILLL